MDTNAVLDDRMITDCGAVRGVRINRETIVLEENPSPVLLCPPQIPPLTA
jgi:hypothetical protein